MATWHSILCVYYHWFNPAHLDGHAGCFQGPFLETVPCLLFHGAQLGLAHVAPSRSRRLASTGYSTHLSGCHPDMIKTLRTHFFFFNSFSPSKTAPCPCTEYFWNRFPLVHRYHHRSSLGLHRLPPKFSPHPRYVVFLPWLFTLHSHRPQQAENFL